MRGNAILSGPFIRIIRLAAFYPKRGISPCRNKVVGYSYKKMRLHPKSRYDETTAIMEKRPKRILFADDDPLTLRVVGHWLNEAGYEVIQVADGKAALERMEGPEEELPDLILTDWSMPGLDGVKLTRRIRDLHLAHYPYIIFLSVRSSSSAIVEALEQGADDYLAKPVNRAELLARIETGIRLLDREKYLVWKTRTDPLTGLLTQPVFYEILSREWDRARRYHVQLSCVMFDIDFFKRINDIHGHAAGDAGLDYRREAVDGGLSDQRLLVPLRRRGILRPPSGDERKTRDVLGRQRSRAAGTDATGNAETTRSAITASFGVAECRPDQRRVEDLVDSADQALALRQTIRQEPGHPVQRKSWPGWNWKGRDRPKGLFGDCRAKPIS